MGRAYPEYQVVLAGSDIKIACKSATPVHWYKNNGSLAPIMSVHNILTIAMAFRDDSGEYICHGYKDEGFNMPFTATATVLVAG